MSQIALNLVSERKIYTVAELSQAVKGLLETQFPDIWVTGEVSNYRPAASGHLYFTLKDSTAQLRAVCFRNQARYLKFKPQAGLAVIARGRLSVYEARGEYQLYVEYLEPAGAGALQVAFEQLKRKLADEGLFDLARKKPLPVLPRTIGVVTSPDGAAIRDMLRVLKRRFPNMNLYLYPAKVQGEGAAAEIVEGIEYFGRHSVVDVVIVGRGGGSIEDLWPFNEESVARAIASSTVPVISAVGHETDFTIADFVADLRAPTPSAAAELVVHRKEDFAAEIHNRVRRLSQNLRLRLAEARERLTGLRMHRALQSLAAHVGGRAQRVDEAVAAMEAAVQARIETARRRSLTLLMQLMRHEPARLLELRWAQVQQQKSSLEMNVADLNRLVWQQLSAGREVWLSASAGVRLFDFRRFIKLKQTAVQSMEDTLHSEVLAVLVGCRNRLAQGVALLEERNPLTILGRGYSITRDASGRIVRDSEQVEIASEVSVRLAHGALDARVVSKKP